MIISRAVAAEENPDPESIDRVIPGHILLLSSSLIQEFIPILMAVVGDAAIGRVSIRHQDMSKLKIHSPSTVPGELSRNRADVLYNNDDDQPVFT